MAKRIMLSGPSGIGKTTVAKRISEMNNIPFISGSMSDLLPSTKEISHEEILEKSKQELALEDNQLVNLRHKLFSKHDNFISDRSFLDSATYFTLKQNKTLPECEIESFLDLCKMCLVTDCEYLILLGISRAVFKDIQIENNHKRITNKYFQYQISIMMEGILNLMGFNMTHIFPLLNIGHINYPEVGEVKVMILNDYDLESRLSWINHFINDKIHLR